MIMSAILFQNSIQDNAYTNVDIFFFSYLSDRKKSNVQFMYHGGS